MTKRVRAEDTTLKEGSQILGREQRLDRGASQNDSWEITCQNEETHSNSYWRGIVGLRPERSRGIRPDTNQAPWERQAEEGFSAVNPSKHQHIKGGNAHYDTCANNKKVNGLSLSIGVNIIKRRQRGHLEVLKIQARKEGQKG